MRRLLSQFLLLLAVLPGLLRAATGEPAPATDPFGSLAWPDLQREFLRGGPVRFDARVQVLAPAFAEDPMNVPVSVSAEGLADVELIVVIVDRNPIRKVLEYRPLAALPRLALRFKLEQASPVRAAVRTKDGRWHVGGTFVESAGGGCTVAGATRRDGSWARTLGEAHIRMQSAPAAAALPPGAARVRLRVMHPMDTGLVSGIPAFHLRRLALRDAAGRELARLDTFEPVSENPVFSLDFALPPAGPLRLVGVDNNGNRVDARVRGEGE